MRVSAALETEEAKQAKERFYSVRTVVRMMIASEHLPFALGPAAGLFAAGASREVARVILSGYLRRFRKD